MTLVSRRAHNYIVVVNLCERDSLLIFKREKEHANQCKDLTRLTSHTKPYPEGKVAQCTMHIVPRMRGMVSEV